MSIVVQVSGIIDRPVAKVFQFVARDHVRNHPRWDPDMKLEQVSDGSIGVGTMIRRVNSHSGQPVEGTMKVVEFEPERSMAVEIQDGPVKTNGRTTFEPAGENRTRITISAEFPGMDDPALRERLTPLIQRSLDNMKRLVESET